MKRKPKGKIRIRAGNEIILERTWTKEDEKQFSSIIRKLSK